jgi:hypothetical protein
MRWSKTTLRNSFFGWLASMPESEPLVDPKVQIEEIRHAMLSGLAELEFEHYIALGRRLRLAEDVQTLWYARHDLMQAMAARVGEAKATAQMGHITGLFHGLVAPSIYAHRPRRF